VAGEQQAHRQHRDLVIAEALSTQPGDDVVTGLVALVRHQLPAVTEQLTHPLLGPGPVTHVTHGLTPGAELRTVGIRHAEQLADDLDRQRQRQRQVQVRGRPVLGQGIEQTRGQLFHPGPQNAHPPGREMRLQQCTQPGIVGLLGVIVAHRPAEQHRIPQPGSPGGVRMGPAKPVIGQQPAYLLIASNQPRQVPHRSPDPVDHAILLQLAEQRHDLKRMSLLQGQLYRHL